MEKLVNIFELCIILLLNFLKERVHIFFFLVILSIDKNETQVYRTLPYIFGGMLQNQTFEMEEVHFHWGLKNNRGAEHVLNGIR